MDERIDARCRLSTSLPAGAVNSAPHIKVIYVSQQLVET